MSRLSILLAVILSLFVFVGLPFWVPLTVLLLPLISILFLMALVFIIVVFATVLG